MCKKWLRRAFCFALIALFLAAWWPFTNVRLSRDTTYITSPLADDGLPNYASAIVEHQRRGVTRDNNGARQFWQGMGPANVSPQNFPLLCQELEVDPPQTRYLVRLEDKSLRQRFVDWMAAQSTDRTDDPGDEDEIYEQRRIADRIFNDIQYRPWTAEELPPLAAWVNENEAALALLIEAAAKPRFFSPPPNFLSDPDTPVAYLHNSHAQSSRDAGRALAARAMLRVSERNYDHAWQDLRACWQLAAHNTAGPTFIDKLVGFTIRRQAMQGTLALLAVDDLPDHLAERILQELNDQPNFDAASALGFAERLSHLDMLLRFSTGRLGGWDDEEIGFEERLFAGDPNVILRIGNKWFDRLESAAAIDNLAERREALLQVGEEIDAASQNLKSKMIVGLFLRSKRSEAIGQMFSSLAQPPITAITSAVDRDSANMGLTRIAAALALYRIRHGDYPNTLSDLSAGKLLPTVPNDPYTDRPFVYQRRGDGYLLYSLFENGVDDDGSDGDHPIVEGEWIATDDDCYSRDVEKSDLVIRLPLPPLELPFEPKPAEPSPE